MAIAVTSAATRGTVALVSGPQPSPSPSNWCQRRDNNFFDVPTATVNTNNIYAIRATYTSSGGGATARISRYFMAFSTSSVPTQANSISLHLYCTNITPLTSFMVVGATAPGTGTNISGSDYKSVIGLTDGATMNGYAWPYTASTGSTAGPGPGPSPSPSPSPFTPVLGWNEIPLNGYATDVWNSGPEWAIALVNYTYDYSYLNPPIPTDQQIGIGVTPSTAPYIIVETGQGQWVLSINPAVTKKVDGVTGTNIKFVNRVGAYALYATSPGGVAGSGNPGCSLTFSGTTPLYCVHPVSGLIVGDFVYTNPTMTTPFVGGALWYGIWNVIGDPSWTGNLYQISNTGQIMATDIGGCAW